MKDDHYEFTLVGLMAALAMLLTAGIGVLVILDVMPKEANPAAEAVIEGVLGLLKDVSAALVGGLITMTRQSPTNPSTVAVPSNAVPQEPPHVPHP